MVMLRIPRNILSGYLTNVAIGLKPDSQEVIIEVPAGQSVIRALENIGLRLSQPVIAVINSEVSDIERILKPGDEVRLFPQISGG